jgi:energy-coupling factor transporter ATP-binding protein EcfA2
MKPFIEIIGSRNSGKSTIIRSLTGAKFGQFRGTITNNDTKRTIEVIGSSPQEMAMDMQELRRILKSAVRSANCNGVVCALQPTRPTVRLSMEAVLLEAKKHGLQVHAYILDPDYSGETGHSATIASRLQEDDFTCQVIDGRKFAHQNADEINEKTHIVYKRKRQVL